MFPTLSDFLEESEVDLNMEIRDDIKTHLSSLLESLNDYFSNLKNLNNYWVQNPFKIKEKPKGFLAMDYENLCTYTSKTTISISSSTNSNSSATNSKSAITKSKSATAFSKIKQLFQNL